MSMLQLKGQVMNIFDSPKGVDKKTGKEFGGQPRIQLLCENILQNGQKRIELINLTVKDASVYKTHQGKIVTVPVGVFVVNNAPCFFALSNENPVAAHN